MFFLKHPEILTFVGTIPLQPRTLDVGQVRNCQRTENILTNIHVTIIILDHYMICVCAQKWLVYIIIVYTYIYIIIICIIIIIIMIIISIVVIKNSNNNNNNTIYIYIYIYIRCTQLCWPYPQICQARVSGFFVHPKSGNLLLL